MTGVHVRTHNLTDYNIKKTSQSTTNFDRISNSITTLAEALKEDGYETKDFSGNTFISEKFGFTQGFNDFQESKAYKGVKDNQLFQNAASWLKTKTNDPFFLYLHLMDVHGPYSFIKEDYDLLHDSPSINQDIIIPNNKVPHKGIVKLPNPKIS